MSNSPEASNEAAGATAANNVLQTFVACLVLAVAGDTDDRVPRTHQQCGGVLSWTGNIFTEWSSLVDSCVCHC